MIAYVFLFLYICYAYSVTYRTYGMLTLIKNTQVEKLQAYNIRFITISIIGIILLSGLRDVSVGPDTDAYLEHFTTYCNSGIFIGKFEWGYNILVSIIGLITTSKMLFLMIVAALINIPIATYILKYSKNCFLSLILYITIGLFTFQLTGLRQCLAIAICLIGFNKAIERKFIWFAALIIVAYLFHESAVCFIPVYFLSSNKVSYWKVLIVSLLCILAYSSFSLWIGNSFVMNHYGEYLYSEQHYNMGGLTYVVIMIISIVLSLIAPSESANVSFSNTNSIAASDDDARIEKILVCMVLIALFTYLLRYQIRAMERISLYYRMAIMILLPNSISMFRDSSKRRILNIGCFILAIALFFYWLKDSAYLYTPFWR